MHHSDKPFGGQALPGRNGAVADPGFVKAGGGRPCQAHGARV